MWVKVGITGPAGEVAEGAANVREDGDPAQLILTAVEEYRLPNPDSDGYDYTVVVSHA